MTIMPIGAVIVGALLAASLVLPETPSWLVSRGDSTSGLCALRQSLSHAAERSLVRLRGKGVVVDDELSTIVAAQRAADKVPGACLSKSRSGALTCRRPRHRGEISLRTAGRWLWDAR
jgi:hypothetical protein